MSADPRKQTVRRLALSRRAALGDDGRAAHGDAITARALALPEIADARTVLAYVSIRTEVPTHALLAGILAAGKTLLLPFIAEDGAMRAAPVSSLDELEPGYRQIPEPRSRMPVDAATADVIIVPGVAFDAAGGRLGYGGGFYDALLRATPDPIRAGLAFEAQFVETIPAEAHDERVDIVITESREVRAPRANGPFRR